MGQNEELLIPVTSIIGNVLKLKEMPSDPSPLPSLISGKLLAGPMLLVKCGWA